jgi:protoporphyrinogen IX oxidase
MIAVWLLGLALALNIGLIDHQPGLGWLHAKLALVALVSGYHGWAIGYAKKLVRGAPTLSGRALRMIGEAPALAVVLIVVLVVVKPF